MATTLPAECLDDKQSREANPPASGPIETVDPVKPKPNGRKARPQATSPKKPKTEVASTAEEACAKPLVEETPADQAMPVLTPMVIVELAIEAQTRFFQDQHGDVFAWISTTGENQHFECLRLGSKAFRARLLDLIKDKTGSVPQPIEIKQAIEILDLRAYNSQRTELANRRSGNGDRTLIDLGDPKWRMVAVTAKGWKIEQQPEPLFYRTQHQQSLVEPVSGGEGHGFRPGHGMVRFSRAVPDAAIGDCAGQFGYPRHHPACMERRPVAGSRNPGCDAEERHGGEHPAAAVV